MARCSIGIPNLAPLKRSRLVTTQQTEAARWAAGDGGGGGSDDDDDDDAIGARTMFECDDDIICLPSPVCRHRANQSACPPPTSQLRQD